MKRENFRVIKEFDKMVKDQQTQQLICQQENPSDDIEKENQPPQPVLNENPETRSVGCQLAIIQETTEEVSLHSDKVYWER